MPLSDPELQQVMRQLLEKFQHLHRLSGSADAERSVDVLCGILTEYAIPHRRESCPLWLSDPLAASLTIPALPDWTASAKTRSFSAHCPEGVEAELMYDARALAFIPDTEREAWRKNVCNKIVVADQGYEDYVQALMQAGAAGLIHIWGSSETALHEETVGPIWGTPVPDDLLRYPSLPIISINQQDGKILLAEMRKAPLRAKVMTQLHLHTAHCSLPVVELAGKTDEFVLLSSHYDSWHEGVTDNATGNALCLALALHFGMKPAQRRGLRIAFWPGHSNARYGGSTWYADHYRADLIKNCVAHINVDSPGCLDGNEIVVNASGAESVAWLNQSIKAVTDSTASRITPLGKGGDQSFWGVSIPLHFALREEPTVRSSLSPGSGGGWWWHTEHDTLDKVDERHLWRDVQIHQGWLDHLLNEKTIPCDLSHYLQLLRAALAQLQGELDPAFDLQPIDALIASLEQGIGQIQDTEDRNQVLGMLHRLRYRASDDFHPDLSFHGGAFPGLQLLRGHRRQHCRDAFWLMLETQFIRQRDRACELLAYCLELLR